ATVTGTSHADTGLSPSTAYSYEVAAIDNAGNESARSAAANATTLAPASWSSQDIGSVGQGGSLVDNGSSLSVSGSGADIWGYADAFHFAHRSLTGDGEIIARIVSLSNTDPWAKAGVMIRESLSPGSRFAMMLMTPGSNGAAFQYRTATNGAAAPSHSADGSSTLPRWLRITRQGNTVRGYLSANGTTWTLRDSVPLPLPDAVYIGLAVTSHNNSTLATAVFDNVSVTLPSPDTVAPSVPQNLSATASGSTQVNLGWSASTDTGGSGLAGYRIYRNGGSTPIATVGPGTTAYNDSGLAAGTTYTYRVAAYDNAGNASDQSAPASVTTPAAPPPDTTPPSVPAGLTATAVSGSRIDLAWSASTDTGGSGLAGSRIYRNAAATPVATATGTSHADTGLSPSTAYSYEVAAIDTAGNESARSAAANATTLAPASWSSQDIGSVGQGGSL